MCIHTFSYVQVHSAREVLKFRRKCYDLLDTERGFLLKRLTLCHRFLCTLTAKLPDYWLVLIILVIAPSFAAAQDEHAARFVGEQVKVGRLMERLKRLSGELPISGSTRLNNRYSDTNELIIIAR